MSERRQFRIAALADLHFDETQRGAFQETFSAASRSANVLALCGDLTAHGRPEQMHALVEELSGVDIPVVAVLGNHDHEADVEHELADILQARGVHLLDGENVIIQGVGFAGTKGFAGGFGRGSLGAFGERLIKEFVQATIDEALKLENALRTLNTDSKVVLLHYSPVPETLKGEPESIFPFLGSSRLLPPLEEHGASVVFHGHAHHGAVESRTPAGIPVLNVAVPVLRQSGEPIRYWSLEAPERRRPE